MAVIIFLMNASVLPFVLCDVTERTFTKSSGVLHTSPYSAPAIIYPSKFGCAGACTADFDCQVFSYNPLTGGCILSGRPDDDSTVYDVVSSDWNTYNTVCPTQKGYVQYDSHQPPLCLRLMPEILHGEPAAARCQQEGARLVRVKTMAVYNIVKQIVIDAGILDTWIFIGASDREVEHVFYWNDGTRLYQGTAMWMNTNEGYQTDEFCTCVSSTKLIIDCGCFYPRPFICQYDI